MVASNRTDDDGFESDDREETPPAGTNASPRAGDAAAATTASSSASPSSGRGAAGGPGGGGGEREVRTDVGLHSRVLFQVIATHPYVREDDDELTFNAADVINVLPNEDEDPDDGWLYG